MRRHPWVFSGGVHDMDAGLEEGDSISIEDRKGNILGVGHFHKGSITARILSFKEEKIDSDFWYNKIELAYKLRETLGFLQSTVTNCYRLVNAEGDGLSGLIVDIYDSAAVIQCHTLGMYRHLEEIAAAIQKLYGSQIDTIYHKNKLGRGYESHHLLGEKVESIVLENDLKFTVNWQEGQKTGFFLDQRENRALLGRYAKGKSVLNTFCYTGGFSVYALAEGATRIDSVDVSASAINLTKENMKLNTDDHSSVRSEVVADVMKYLKECEEEYDILVVDPPAFAKSQRKRHNAVQAYKRLNALALRRIKPNGLLFTYSCSQVVSRSLFNDTMRAAAIESKRDIQILHYLSQPSDHPSNIFHPEGSYLKGLVLRVN